MNFSNDIYLDEMKFFAMVEEEQKQLEEAEKLKELEMLEWFSNLPRWDSKPHQMLRSNYKHDPKKLKDYERIEDFYVDGDFEALYRELFNFYDSDNWHKWKHSHKKYRTKFGDWLSYELFRKLAWTKIEYEDFRSIVIATAVEMVEEYYTETDFPFVYRLRQKVLNNIFPNMVRDINKPKRLLTYSNNVRSIQQMLENGEDIPDRKAHLYVEAVLDKLHNEEAHEKLLQTMDFTEQEKVILSLWKTEPNISTRKISASLNISQSTASRAVRKLKEKLA